MTTATFTQPFGDFDLAQPDGSLGVSVDTDRGRVPENAVYVFGPAYDGTCFAIVDNRLYYCLPKQPEAWPALYYVEIGPPSLPGVTGVFHNGQAHYINEAEIWYVQGTGNGLFQPFPTNARTGAQSTRGAISVAGRGIYHTGSDGIYLFASGTDQKITEDTLEPIFRGEDTNGIPGVADMTNSWLFEFESKLYFGYRDSSGTYPDNVIVLNLVNGKITYYNYAQEISALARDEFNDRFLIGCQDGFIRVIENEAYTDDDGTAISWEIQSKDFTLPTRRHFPRWVKYDIDASSSGSVTGTLLLDDSTHHQHTITGDRVTKRRLVGEGNGRRAAVKIEGTGPAKIYTVEFE